tara:strand:- start:250 stop:528 length:279 start_codon:yes stop_codon:yes gene_type:complete
MDIDLENINHFFQLYENTLKEIYKTAYTQHNKGILFIDIHNNIDGKCNTQYMPVHSLSNELNDIKKQILESDNKMFYCVKDNTNTIFIDRPF